VGWFTGLTDTLIKRGSRNELHPKSWTQTFGVQFKTELTGVARGIFSRLRQSPSSPHPAENILPPLRSRPIHPQPPQTSYRRGGEIGDFLRDCRKHFEIAEYSLYLHLKKGKYMATTALDKQTSDKVSFIAYIIPAFAC
jgi:hypothetical protein